MTQNKKTKTPTPVLKKYQYSPGLLLQNFKTPVSITIAGVLFSSILFIWIVSAQSDRQHQVFNELANIHTKTIEAKLTRMYDTTKSFLDFLQTIERFEAETFEAFEAFITEDTQHAGLKHILISTGKAAEIFSYGDTKFSPSGKVREKFFADNEARVDYETLKQSTLMHLTLVSNNTNKLKLTTTFKIDHVIAKPEFKTVMIDSLAASDKYSHKKLELTSYGTSQSSPINRGPFSKLFTIEIEKFPNLSWNLAYFSAPQYGNDIGVGALIILLLGLTLTAILGLFSFRAVSDKIVIDQKVSVLTKRYKDSEARLSHVFEHVVDAMILIHESGIIYAANAAASEMFGYSKNQLKGQNVDILMPEPYHSKHDTYLQNYLSTGEKKIIGTIRELSAKRADGTTFPIELSVSEIQLGKQRLFSGVVRDISKRNQMLAAIEFEKQKFISVIQNMPLGYHLWEISEGQDLVLKDANEDADNILNLHHKVLFGKKLEEAFPALRNTSIVEKCKKLVNLGGSFEQEFVSDETQEDARVFSGIFFQVYEGSIISIFREVTQSPSSNA